MNCAREARRLADYISALDGEILITSSVYYNCPNHIGALFTDIILQAGVNYEYVVRPRVQRLVVNYPEVDTRSKFQELVKNVSLETLISWKNKTKIYRIESLLYYAEINNIDTCYDLRLHLVEPANRLNLLDINGVGPKTLDYLLKLLGYDSVAVDRHIYSFIEMAEVNVRGYDAAKKIVEYAADFLEISRSSLDHSIWSYMAKRNSTLGNNSLSRQLAIPF
ncbi:hypothetical protein GCM10028808_71010 [Spirosoma migulaei]